MIAQKQGTKSILLVTILNMIAGVLVAKGIVDAGSKTDLVNISADFIGAAVYVLTVGTGLYQFFKTHRHNITEQAKTERYNVTGVESEPVEEVKEPNFFNLLFARFRNYALATKPEVAE